MPQLLRENFVTAVVDEYESCVFREMTAKGLSNYMREDPQQGQYRAQLESSKARLQEAVKILSSV